MENSSGKGQEKCPQSLVIPHPYPENPLALNNLRERIEREFAAEKYEEIVYALWPFLNYFLENIKKFNVEYLKTIKGHDKNSDATDPLYNYYQLSRIHNLSMQRLIEKKPELKEEFERYLKLIPAEEWADYAEDKVVDDFGFGLLCRLAGDEDQAMFYFESQTEKEREGRNCVLSYYYLSRMYTEPEKIDQCLYKAARDKYCPIALRLSLFEEFSSHTHENEKSGAAAYKKMAQCTSYLLLDKLLNDEQKGEVYKTHSADHQKLFREYIKDKFEQKYFDAMYLQRSPVSLQITALIREDGKKFLSLFNKDDFLEKSDDRYLRAALFLLNAYFSKDKSNLSMRDAEMIYRELKKGIHKFQKQQSPLKKVFDKADEFFQAREKIEEEVEQFFETVDEEKKDGDYLISQQSKVKHFLARDDEAQEKYYHPILDDDDSEGLAQYQGMLEEEVKEAENRAHRPALE